jgi:PEP-CTERM motif
VDSDGSGGNAAITYEQLRFYTPGSSTFPTYYGQAVPDLCAGAGAECGEPMTFDTSFGGQLVATAYDGSTRTNGIVYQDLSPSFGGLGVVSARTTGSGDTRINGSDEINRSDVLTLTFAQQVNVVGFHFFEGDHSSTDSGDRAWLRIDGGAWQHLSLSPNYVTNDPSQWYSGSVFDFRRANQDFYLGAVKITSAIPEPQTYALALVGLALIGSSLRRRRS